MKVSGEARIIKGKLPPNASGAIKEFIEGNEGKLIGYSFETIGKKRSTLQNSYWWGIIINMIQAEFKRRGTPASAEAVHYFVMSKSAITQRTVVNMETGEILETMTRSSTELTTIEFCEMIADVQRWAAEVLDLYLPDPIAEFREEKLKPKP